MNNQVKVLLIVAAVVAFVGVFLVELSIKSPKSAEVSEPLVKAAPVSVSVNGKKVTADQPVAAQVGTPETLDMTSQSKDAVTITVPGLQDTPVTVAAGQVETLQLSSPNPGTYPIIEHGTMPNTRSVEGGTTQYDMEVGTVQFK